MLNRDRKAFGKTFRFRASPIMVERQLGCSIWDTDGNEYLDFSAGGTVANTGYCHPKVVEAAITELRKFTHGLTPLFPSQPAIELAEKLKEITPGRFEKGVWMGASGSDAAETVYDFLPAASGRRKIITFFGSHHGLTAGAHMLSGHNCGRWPRMGLPRKDSRTRLTRSSLGFLPRQNCRASERWSISSVKSSPSAGEW